MKPSDISTSQWIRFNLFFLLEHFLGLHLFEKIAGKWRNNLTTEIEDNLKNSGRGELLPFAVETTDVSHNYLKDKILSNVEVPVVFKGAAKEWDCVKKWNLDYFKENYGDSQISIIDNVGLMDRSKPQKFEITTFSNYIEELKKGSVKYLKFSRIMDEDSTLRKDFDLEWLKKFMLGGSFGEQFLMFMGGNETLTPVHCGFANTVFIQVTGRKKWIMWAPNERIFFDPRAERRPYNFSLVDPHTTIDPKFPLYKYAKRYEIVLDPGDVLWFPSHLWHQVENIEGGISVAYKFVHLPTCFKSSKLLSTLFFLATRPSIFTEVFFHKVKQKDYIFSKKQTEIDKALSSLNHN